MDPNIQTVAQNIKTALSELAEPDRSGFLFALSISDMLLAGWSKQRITEEVMKALDTAWENRHLVTGGVS